MRSEGGKERGKEGERETERGGERKRQREGEVERERLGTCAVPLWTNSTQELFYVILVNVTGKHRQLHFAFEETSDLATN